VAPSGASRAPESALASPYVRGGESVSEPTLAPTGRGVVAPARGGPQPFGGALGLALALLVVGCGAPEVPAPGAPLDVAHAELEALRLAADEPGGAAIFREILEDTVAKDPYVGCLPAPRALFFGPGEDGVRNVAGALPHYGVFLGPMSYRVRRQGAQLTVEATIAVEPPHEDAWLELPDCAQRAELEGEVRCEGTPFSVSGSTDACPASGTFGAWATAKNVDALLARWSRDAEAYWNRDALRFGLPVRYDFTFLRARDALGVPVDLSVPLAPTCGRTPYFSAMRSGWSLPIVAHEVGHVLGLLDEYETLSGITRLYPKTPFAGAERSRMGLSMKEDTLLVPLHHYLVVRRSVCVAKAASAPLGEGIW
jgi:hypothetical protein